MKLLGQIAAALLAFALPAMPAAAQDRPISLAGDVKAVKTTVDASGAEQTELVAPDVIVPGDRLIFGTDYSNSGAETVTDFVVTNPLPGAVRLAPDADPALTVSVDGGATWGTLETLTVTGEDGAARAAEHGDVTHVRWTLAAIEPGQSGRVEYPAIIR
ncbi:MAG: hypothetical protein AAGK02_09580 [Pseudomonadota bacterium]